MADFSLQLIIFNLVLSWGLLALIWLVQVIIYPGFHQIPSGSFIDYHRWYVKRISIIVLPLMISELTMTAWWLFDAGSSVSVISAGLVLIVWLSTFLLQVPIHHRLKFGKEENLIRRLVATNWVRTIAWSLKALLITLAFVVWIF
jgi:hypothetical protein